MAPTQAEAIVNELSRWTLKRTQRELGLSEALGKRVYDWHQSWSISSDYAAGWTFQGDAFKSLDLASWSAEDALEANSRLRILHAVYGLLRPLDQYSPVRLEMGQSWCHQSKHRTMASFWKQHLPNLVLEDMKRQGQTHILNLASSEYADVALHGFTSENVVTCQFLEERPSGPPKSISAFAKSARGAMAQHVLRHRISDPEQLNRFNDKGYAFAAELSTPSLKVFVRPLSL